jgi:hypothetical protein
MPPNPATPGELSSDLHAEGLEDTHISAVDYIKAHPCEEYEAIFEADFVKLLDRIGPHLASDDNELDLSLSEERIASLLNEITTEDSLIRPLNDGEFAGESYYASLVALHTDDRGNMVQSREEQDSCNTKKKLTSLKSWYARLNEWLDYRRDHPNEDPQSLPKPRKLHNWVNKVRYNKKLYDEGKRVSSMYQERIDLLQALDFRWANCKDKFTVRYSQLRDFCRIVGHADVPVKPVHKGKGPAKDQVASAIQKQLGDRVNAISQEDRAVLEGLFRDTKFCRYITLLRDTFKVWHSTKGADGPKVLPVEDDACKSKSKGVKLEERKHKLEEIAFSFTKQNRRRLS